MRDQFEIVRVSSGDAGIVDELIPLLADAVDDGASVGFLSPLDLAAARRYFEAALSEVAARTRLFWVASDGEGVVGTVQLVLATQPNSTHRAELVRLLVHRRGRRRGIATALLAAAERGAIEAGRSLLVLNTRAGDPPERLYAALGWQTTGRIPGYARNPDGTLNDTTIMFKELRRT